MKMHSKWVHYKSGKIATLKVGGTSDAYLYFDGYPNTKENEITGDAKNISKEIRYLKSIGWVQVKK